MPNVHFTDVRVAQKLRREADSFTWRRDDSIEDSAVLVIRPKHQFALYEIFGKCIERAVRSAIMLVNENRTDFGVGIAIRQRLV